jgi:ribosomal protein S18 acetylase RimI-like enzyme
VAIGKIDYQAQPGAGTLSQLAVQAAWHSCGLGTILIRAAEQRILARGLDRAELGVESNPEPVRCMSGWAMSPMAAGRRHGMKRRQTAR